MTDSRVKQALWNNLIWCDTLCRAHDMPGSVDDLLWHNHYAVPRFYPNAITLSGKPEDHASQMAAITTLTASEPTRQWSVKDSFAALDLAPLGYHILLEATWLWREADLAAPSQRLANVEWERIQNRRELGPWEEAWNGRYDPDLPPVFLPKLLINPDIAFLVAYQGPNIAAGAIAYRHDNVVGLSNVFVSGADKASFWAGAVATALQTFPGYPLVGYEQGEALAAAQGVGFEPLAPLRVWAKA